LDSSISMIESGYKVWAYLYQSFLEAKYFLRNLSQSPRMLEEDIYGIKFSNLFTFS